MLTALPGGRADLPGVAFRGPRLLARAGPFAAVAVVAELSLALPPGPSSLWPVAASLGLLVLAGLGFALPWSRLPGWMTVLVPLAYTGSVLALILADGVTSGSGIAILIPLIWTALFHQRWESGCVVLAIVAVELTISLTPQVAPPEVIARRVLLWAALGVLLSVATHGLRDRISRDRQERELLQDELRELSMAEDRDRIAAELSDQVVQRVFATGMALQSAAGLTQEPEVRRRLRKATAELDHAVQLIRDAIFGLEQRPRGAGIRAMLLELCDSLPAGPAVRFAGPVDTVLDQGRQDRLMALLREALPRISTHARLSRVDVTAGQSAIRVAATAAASGSAEPVRDVPDLDAAATAAGFRLEAGGSPEGATLTWIIPLPDGPARSLAS